MVRSSFGDAGGEHHSGRPAFDNGVSRDGIMQDPLDIVYTTMHENEPAEGNEDSEFWHLGAWWNRMCVIANLMVWTVDDINEHLIRGTFRNFKPEELCRLLSALFEDCDLLQQTITAIERAGNKSSVDGGDQGR